MLNRQTALLLAFIIFLSSIARAHAQSPLTWKATGGPTGGLITALAPVQNAAGVIYAGANGGAYMTRDDGARWQMIARGLPDDPAVTALAITRDPNVVFAGTHNGIYRTTDAGNNWTITDRRLANEFIQALVIDPQSPNLIYAGTNNSILKSENNGDTWSDIGGDLKSKVSALAMPPDGSAVFAATDAGIYVSRDRGARWQTSSDGLPEGARPQSIVITKSGFLTSTGQGIFRSKDGKVWSAAGAPANTALASPMVNDSRQPDRVLAVTKQGIIRSNDGGVNWTLLASPLSESAIYSLAIGDKNTLYAGTARGVWKSGDEGSSWTSLNTGLVSTTVNDLQFVAGKPSTLLAATRYGLQRSQDHGASWTEAVGLKYPYILSIAIDPKTNDIYAGSWDSSVSISKDGGANFTTIVESLAKAPINSLIILHPTENNTILYAGTLGNGLFKSTDGGQKWNPQTSLLPGITRVTALESISASTLYAGTERGLYRLDLSKTDAAWQSVSPSLPVDEANAIAVDPNKPQTIFVCFASNGVYRSDDGGAQWHALGRSAFPTRTSFRSIALNPGKSSVVYAGTNRGIYRSEDSGTTWATANEGLSSSAEIQSIVIDPQAPEEIYAGTLNNGVMSTRDTITTAFPTDILVGVGGALFGVLFLLVLARGVWRSRFGSDAQEREWQREWPQWDMAIDNALRTKGEADEESLSKQPRRHLARALQRYKEQHPEDALTLSASPVALKLETFPTMQKFLSHWKAAWEVVESEEAFHSVASQMMDQLCSLLGFTRVDARSYKGLVGYVVRAPALRLKIPPRFPIIFLPRHEVDAADLEALRELMAVLNMVSYFALIIDLRDEPPKDSRQSLKHLVREAIHDFIVLDGKDIRSLLTASDHPRRLVNIILSQVDLTVISPYVTSGPVPANMFFGREYELKTIVRTVRDTNFAIVGGRKIGKTSVLARVHQSLQDAPEYQPFYLDCQAINSHGAFFEAIDTMWKKSVPTPTPEGFRRMATELATQYPSRTIVLLFDEIDGLLKHDIAQGEQLFRIFRALAQEVSLRFVFCGEKILNAALHDPKLVFFNFCNLMRLTYLSREEARRVVTDPMQEMGISLEDGELANQIVELAAGHPNIVQYICQKLTERINQRRDRLVTHVDLNIIRDSAQFAEYFAEVSWGNASALERLITLLMLEHPEVTLSEMAQILRARDLQIPPEQVDNAFEDLTLYSILRRDGPKYTFAAKAFPEVLRRSQDVYGLLLSFTQEIQAGNGAHS